MILFENYSSGSPVIWFGFELQPRYFDGLLLGIFTHYELKRESEMSLQQHLQRKDGLFDGFWLGMFIHYY
jgi:hypothetical protein